MTGQWARARMGTVVHVVDGDKTGIVYARCGVHLGTEPRWGAQAYEWYGARPAPAITRCEDCVRVRREPHHHEPWMIRESARGGWFCAACGDHVDPPSQVCDTDLRPTVSVQHRCPRMREHIIDLDYREPGQAPGSLPVPCGDCYSIVVTTIRVPWQPSREFTITERK